MSGTFDLLDQRPHSVYLVVDEDNRPLYVGCALDPAERMRMHLEPSTQSAASRVIQSRMACWVAKEYPTKADARAAERRAIERGTPLLNKQHSPRYRKNVRELPIVAHASP